MARTLWQQAMSREKPVVQVNQANRKAKDSSRTHETFVCISKSAVREFALFIESVYFTVHFGCIYLFFENESTLLLDGL